MACENSIGPTFSQSLVSILGDDFATLLINYLEKENAILENGLIDAKRLELALESLFGEASLIIMQKLQVVQKKSISMGFR